MSARQWLCARWSAASAALAIGLLSGCAGTVTPGQRPERSGSIAAGVSDVSFALTAEATKEQADTPQFNGEEIAKRLRSKLQVKGLTSPSADHRVEIVVTDIRVRGAFNAIMFGFMAGDDHVDGKVRLVDASGREIRSSTVHASYAFGGLAGGQDSVRMNWLYDKFSDLALADLEQSVGSAAMAGPIGTSAKTDPVRIAVAADPAPDATVRASGLQSRPSNAVHIDMGTVLNKTWIYPHPLDEASYGNVELTFTSAGLSANSKRGRSTGSFDVRDDELCIYLKSSGTTCYFLIETGGSQLLFFPRSGIKSKLVIRDESPTNRAQTPVATSSAGTRLTLTDPVPFLSEKRQAEYRERFLPMPLPRAIAISDNGHLGYATGAHPKDHSLPSNPADRALQACANAAGKPCVLYAVDNEIVYETSGGN